MKNFNLKTFIKNIFNGNFKTPKFSDGLNSIKKKFNIPLDVKNSSSVLGERFYQINKNEGVRIRNIGNTLKIEREMSPDWVAKSPLMHLHVDTSVRPTASIERVYTPGKKSRNITERVFTTRKDRMDYLVSGYPTIHRPSY